MTVRKKITNVLKTVLKKRPKTTYPDMPEDPKDLARAMFWPNDEKLKARRRAQDAQSEPDQSR